jgi:hypothetical protein
MDTMRRTLPLAIAIVLGVPCGALLAGCGSKTQTVSAAETPAGATATKPASTPTTTTSTTPAQTTTNGGSSAPATTRTAPEPAFTEQKTSSTASAENAAAAAAVLSAHGYSTSDTSVYHPNQTLRVLVGTRTGASDGYGQQAFFFVDGRYIGTDSKQPSATLRVVGQADTEITLSYPLYRKGDPLSTPSGGQAQVRFQLNNGKLVALNPIPPASVRQ